MRIDIFTIFPELFNGPFDASIIKRARERGLVEVWAHNIRDYATDKHQLTDDAPYGGGGGMVMKPEPLFAAVEAVRGEEICPVILLTPQGRVFTQAAAQELAALPRFMLICGRYEGVDERVREYLATDELSIGDYVLSGGEPAALVVVDAVVRLLPGALGYEHSAAMDSHATGVLEGPHYTRPPVFRDWPVPEVLSSGHHAKIDAWRRQQALLRTLARRPDLLATAPLTAKERVWLRGQGYEGAFRDE
ncbi:MAG: tRNA (guanosine(37)-N1)-methyltransferase TrmD [Caldilineales bacterium]|nr:tRNA (guanosine(37)-N1)-methyltransferase TrmD [Caldilineales bacterium]MCW5860262.1 tRNA (guanosine(37)-N1)-methyltransferase TrmD [Caldilineales bacterium]